MVNVFFKQFVAEVCRDVHVLMLWDKAGFHTANKVKIPDNVTIVPLPPYSPELNPVRIFGITCGAIIGPIESMPTIMIFAMPQRMRGKKLLLIGK